MKNQLTKNLFRSFLRWNREVYVCRSPLQLEDSTYQFRKYLNSIPGKNYAHLNDVQVIKNSEQFQYVLYEIFRNYKDIKPEDYDHAFFSLRELNKLKEPLEVNYRAHLSAIDPENLKYRKYKIGEVVRLNEIRGVVCGWHIYDKIQYVNVLLDTDDQEMYQNTTQKILNNNVLIFTSDLLEPVQSKALKYIHNHHIPLFFRGFDQFLCRYIPRVELSFRYAGDIDDFMKNKTQQVVIQSKEDENAQNPHTTTVTAQRVARLMKTTSKFSTAIRKIFEKHEVDLYGANGYPSIGAPASSHDTSRINGSIHSGKNSLLPHQNNLSFNSFVHAVIPDIIALMVELEKISTECIHGYPIVKKSLDFSQRILRGPRFMNHEQDPDYRQEVLSTSDAIFVYMNDTKRINVPTYIQMNGIENTGESMAFLTSSKGFVPLSHLISSGCRALEINRQWFATTDSLLQLRFQSKGLTHLEELVPSIEKLESEYGLKTRKLSRKSDPRIGSSKKANSGSIENAMLFGMIDSLTAGTAKFSYGSRIRHKKFGYRGVIVGWDQRPSAFVSKWEAVVGLPSGDNQPFYKVLADEHDIERIFGANYQSPEYYYVAEENIEMLPHHSSFSLTHRNKAIYLHGFDETSNEFFYPSKASFCFDSLPPPSTPSSDTNSHTSIMQAYNKRLELLLLDLYAFYQYSVHLIQLRQCLPQNQSHNPDDVQYLSRLNMMNEKLRFVEKFTFIRESAYEFDDILELLENAPTHESSKAPFMMLAFSEKHHVDVAVRKWLRLGTNYLNRCKFKEADDCFKKIMDLDPVFSGALWLRIMCNQSLENVAELKSLLREMSKYFPEHFSFLIAKSLFKLDADGDGDQAIQATKKLLAYHPWTPSLSSSLNFIAYKDSKALPTDMKQTHVSDSDPDSV